MLKLFHNSTLLGTITGYHVYGFWWRGDIELTEAAESFQEVFIWFTSENRPMGQEPPFAEDILEDWYIETPGKGKRSIGLPGIYRTKRIIWRYFEDVRSD